MGSDVRTKIIIEATRLFAERGYDGTSIQAISEAVGIKRPSLVYHFKNKEGLREEVLNTLLAHWNDDLPRIMAAATSGGDRLNGALNAMFGFFVEDKNRARLLARELIDRPEEMRTRLTEQLSHWTSLLTDYIEAGKVAGSVRPDLDPQSYTLQIILAAISTIAVGDVASAMLPDDQPDVPRQLKELVRIARSALFNPRPQ